MSMPTYSSTSRRIGALRVKLTTCAVAAVFVIGHGGSALYAATAFDAGGGTHWWYNPLNWSVDRIPPNNADGTATTDAQINLGETFAGSMGEGVVYDPASDPGFAAAQPP